MGFLYFLILETLNIKEAIGPNNINVSTPQIILESFVSLIVQLVDSILTALIMSMTNVTHIKINVNIRNKEIMELVLIFLNNSRSYINIKLDQILNYK